VISFINLIVGNFEIRAEEINKHKNVIAYRTQNEKRVYTYTRFEL